VSNALAKRTKHSRVAAPSRPFGAFPPTKFEQKGPICLLLFSAVILVFSSVRRFDYVNYDDPDYVSANPHVQSGLNWQNVQWAFTTGRASNWHPLTWLSHMLDWQFFGNDPGAQHVISAALHAINTMLLFLVLRRMTGAHWRSAIVAALFGLHPLRVESVAWISERKDVLSGLFLFLTLGSYCRYAALRVTSVLEFKPGLAWYSLALVCFALGLMSKPMLVTVPFLLLLLDYWPLSRFSLAKPDLKPSAWLLLEKGPFFVLAAASCIITFVVQRRGGAVSTSLPFWGRIANALVSYARYLGKTIWPTDLSVLYPHPGYWSGWQVVGSGGLFLLILVAAIAQSRLRPYFITGWLWFVGGLVPVIGLVQVGIQSMADRYTYIPCIGLFIAVVWGLGEQLQRWPSTRPVVATCTLVMLLICTCLCAYQVQFWHDSEALFTRAVQVTSNNYLAYNNLGFYQSGKAKREQAKENYRKSIAINPTYEDALNNLGFALAGEGKYSEAIPYYEAALRVSPNQPEIRNNYGNALSELGRLDDAIQQYALVIKDEPNHADARNNLGIALAMQGKLDDAVGHFRAAIRAKPNYASAHSNLGNALAAEHKISEAMVEYQESLRLNPNDAQAHNNLGNVLLEQDKLDESIEQYGQALRLNPNNPEAQFNLAIVLVKKGRKAEAVTHLQEALRLNPGNVEARRQLDTLRRQIAAP
jgi:tetratricopeptide (TPR) repeat protein